MQAKADEAEKKAAEANAKADAEATAKAEAEANAIKALADKEAADKAVEEANAALKAIPLPGAAVNKDASDTKDAPASRSVREMTR